MRIEVSDLGVVCAQRLFPIDGYFGAHFPGEAARAAELSLFGCSLSAILKQLVRIALRDGAPHLRGGLAVPKLIAAAWQEQLAVLCHANEKARGEMQ